MNNRFSTKTILPFFLMLFIFSSCTKWETTDVKPVPELEVHVTGTLSGKSRENINVGIYLSKEDAENKVNRVKPDQRTNSDGKTTFNELEGIKYWIRAGAITNRTIRETQSLSNGSNTFSISVI